MSRLMRIARNYAKSVNFSKLTSNQLPDTLKPIKPKKIVISDNKSTSNKEKENTTNQSKQWKFAAPLLSVGFVGFGGYLIYLFGTPTIDANGNPIVEEDLAHLPNLEQYTIRAFREFKYYGKLIREPSREKLLPDPLPDPYIQPKYTLVLEIKDVLVHPDWTYNTGWRFKKRPGLDYFLNSLQGLYEIVIYTSEQGMTVFPLVEAIDPKNIISYKLVRDSTHFTGGRHVKSLDKLNRDLSRVIAIDWDEKNVQFQPDNLLRVRKWEGEDDDYSLIDLANFLQIIVENNIDDVRDVLEYYRNFDDPVQAFREKHRQYLDYLENQMKAKKEAQDKSLVSHLSISRRFH